MYKHGLNRGTLRPNKAFKSDHERKKGNVFERKYGILTNLYGKARILFYWATHWRRVYFKDVLTISVTRSQPERGKL